MGEASEKLFKANAQELNPFLVTVGLSEYIVKIPGYSHGGDHYVSEEVFKGVLSKVKSALDEAPELTTEKPSKLKTGDILPKLMAENSVQLQVFLDRFEELDRHSDDFKFVDGVRYRKFENSIFGKFKGIWPAVEILAGMAHHLQNGKGTDDERKLWGPIVKGFVKNRPGLTDLFRLTSRSRAAIGLVSADIHILIPVAKT